MMNKNERMEKMNNAGINTGKYFSLDLPNGLAPGSKIALVINENGEPEVVSEPCEKTLHNDPIVNQIIYDGYVRNTKLHRRFVMAQMFYMLNYVCPWDPKNREKQGYNYYLKNYYGYGYTFDMMLEEVRVLSKLEVRDSESFDERSHFFTKKVILDVLCDYIAKLKTYIDGLPTRKCKGVPYKRIKSVNVFVEDLNKKIFRPLEAQIMSIKYARSYHEIYGRLRTFIRMMIKLPYETPKSKAWIDAFKGEGAYYTLKNLVMFHDCYIEVPGQFHVARGTKAMNFLKGKLVMYQGEGWRMFALMKKVIADNNFNFTKRMSEIYSEK